MKSYRKPRSRDSSYDLFLDTICNAFGGIMFIAILISILMQIHHDEPVDVAPNRGGLESESVALQSKLESLQSQVEQLAASNSDREKILYSDASREIRDLQIQRDSALSRLAQSQQTQKKLLEERVKIEESSRKLQQELQELTNNLSLARIAVSQRSKEVAKALDAAETTATLPKVTPTLKGNLLFAIRYGKLYLISDIAGNSKLGVNENHVVASQGTQGKKVQLKPMAGWDLSTTEAETAMQSIMGSHSNKDIFFSIAVWSDSFGFFQKWKEMVVKAGYDYDLRPFDDSDELVIGKTDSATVQ